MMNTFKRLLFICGCLSATTMIAQNDWSGKTYKYYSLYPGYVVTLTNDTIQGYIEHGDRTMNQDKAVYYSDINNRKTKKVYKPEDLKGYMVGDKVYRSIHWSGGLLEKPLKFNLLVQDGAITQYHFYTKDEGYVVQVRSKDETDAEYDARICQTQMVFQKNDGKPFAETSLGLGFAKKMAEIVADYPELSTKVKNKEKGYGMLNLLTIIDEYNVWAAQK
jgi:hypothetical protein